MNCVDMLNSLNHCDNSQEKYENEPLSKKRKREDTSTNMIMIDESNYSHIIRLFNEMNEKITHLQARVDYLEEENKNKTNLINSINSNYLTKEHLKKIRIYSTLEPNDVSYIN